MAKLNGPLMSMNARGQVGKSLIFSGWNGLKTVKAHAVPANPKTSGQTTQRGFMSAAVVLWHTVPYILFDRVSNSLLASVQVSPLSGFNIFCRQYINGKKAGLTVRTPNRMEITANTGGAFTLTFSTGHLVAGYVRYGVAPRSLGNIQLLSVDVGTSHQYTTLSGLVVGSDVFFEVFTMDAGNTWITGLYKVRVLA